MGNPVSNPPRRGRRLLQFSLQTFLLINLTLALVLGYEVNLAHRRAAAYVALDYCCFNPDWQIPNLVAGDSLSWRQQLWMAAAGKRAIARVERITLTGSVVDDGIIELLHYYPELVSVRLDQTRATDAGLKSLASLPNLRYLAVSTADVTDAGFESFAASPMLQSVYLNDVNVHGPALQAFVSCPHLRQITLYRTELVDAYLPALLKCQNAITVRIDSARLAGSTIATLSERLIEAAEDNEQRGIDLEVSLDCATDESIVSLGTCSYLAQLQIGGAELTDRGLSSLINLPNLKVVSLRESPKITLKGVFDLLTHGIQVDVGGAGYGGPEWAQKLLGQLQALEIVTPRWALVSPVMPKGQFQERQPTYSDLRREASPREVTRLYLGAFQVLPEAPEILCVGRLHSFANSPTGISRWKLPSGEPEICTIETPVFWQGSCSQGGKLIAGMDTRDDSIILVRNDIVVETLASPAARGVGRLKLSPDGQYLTSIWHDYEPAPYSTFATVWDLDSRKTLFTKLLQPTEMPVECASAYDGTHLWQASTTKDQRESLVTDVVTGETRRWSTGGFLAYQYFFSFRNACLVARSWDPETDGLAWFDLGSELWRRFTDLETDEYWAMTDSGLLAFHGLGGMIEIHDARAGMLLDRIPGTRVRELAFADNGRYLVGCTNQQCYVVWDTSDLAAMVKESP